MRRFDWDYVPILLFLVAMLIFAIAIVIGMLTEKAIDETKPIGTAQDGPIERVCEDG